MSTLIVRDATLVVNGAPEGRGDTAEHLHRRIAEVSRMSAESVEAYVEVLQQAGSAAALSADEPGGSSGPGARGESIDPEALLALTILGLAQPDRVESKGISTVACGRRVAARFEQTGDPDGALTLIELLRERYPNHTALERDNDAIMRRLGMIQDLVERYLRRANDFFRQGKIHEGVSWLREILVLDPTRKDVARMIRDLRIGEDQKARRRIFSPTVVLALLVPLSLAALVVRERSLRHEYDALPNGDPASLASMERRLEAVEEFVDENRLWHGALMAVSERSDLRTRVEKLRTEKALKDDEQLVEFMERADNLELLYYRGRMHAEHEDFELALADFEEALDLASSDWEHRQRVEADVAAIIDYLADLSNSSEPEEQL